MIQRKAHPSHTKLAAADSCGSDTYSGYGGRTDSGSDDGTDSDDNTDNDYGSDTDSSCESESLPSLFEQQAPSKNSDIYR